MRYLIFLMLATLTGCAAQPLQPSQKEELEQLLRSGQDVFIEGRTFTEDLDFTRMLSANPIGLATAQVKTGSSITFKNCRFIGQVTAYAAEEEGACVQASFLSNLSFLECEFREAVSFRGSSVLGAVDFSKSRFFGEANFEETAFHGNARFNECLFYGELRFQNAFFHQRVNFMKAEFDQTAFFQNAVFQGEAQFSVTRFRGYADFSLIHCRHNSYFNYSEFSDRCTFADAHFASGADFLHVRFAEATFKNGLFLGQTRFHKSGAEQMMDFENSFFLRGRQGLKD